MPKVMFDKRLVAELARIGQYLKAGNITECALPGLLFEKSSPKNRRRGVYRRKIEICGCGLLEPVDGCAASGKVSEADMSRMVAAIYKRGYVPRGLVMISPGGECCPYDSIDADRAYAFRFLFKASKGYKVPFVMLVIDDNNMVYTGIAFKNGYGVCRKATAQHLTKTKGEVIWITQDNWTSSILKDLEIKQLQ